MKALRREKTMSLGRFVTLVQDPVTGATGFHLEKLFSTPKENHVYQPSIRAKSYPISRTLLSHVHGCFDRLKLTTYISYLTKCLTHNQLSKCLHLSAVLVYFSWACSEVTRYQLKKEQRKYTQRSGINFSGAQPTPS